MKFILFLPIFFLFSCGTFSKNAPQKHMEKQFEPEKQNTVSPYQKVLDNAYDNSAIDEYYKAIYKQEKLVIAEDAKMLSITEMLFSSVDEYNVFYFVVFTKSMNGADGFYSEALGVSAMKFISEKTSLFADYFSSHLSKLNSVDLDNWVYYVQSEISIANEGNEEEIIKALEQTLKKNVQNGTSEQKKVIDLFITKLNQ